MKTSTWKLSVAACAFAAMPLVSRADNQNNYGTDRTERAPAQRTAEDQSNNKNRLETTRQIRQQIVNDKSLSTAAHNVTIVTADSGDITLKGTVRSDEEKGKILQIAKNISPNAQVTDQMTLK